eukprot:284554-Chlamydomonas_euryale.AAC.1
MYAGWTASYEEWQCWMLSRFLDVVLEFRAVAVDRAGEFSNVDREDCARMAMELGQLQRDMVRMDVAAEAAFVG